MSAPVAPPEWCRHAALLDVARTRRRPSEEQLDRGAFGPDCSLVDVGHDECLAVLVLDLGLELDRPVLADQTSDRCQRPAVVARRPTASTVTINAVLGSVACPV